MDLDEHPFGAALDVDALCDPRFDARRGRRVVAGERAVLEPNAEPLAGQREWAGDHEQTIVVARAHARALALLVAASLRQIADRPVDLVDLVGLTRIGRGRERQIDVAPELVEHDELVIDAAPLAV